jgi:hypothetical protein
MSALVDYRVRATQTETRAALLLTVARTLWPVAIAEQ